MSIYYWAMETVYPFYIYVQCLNNCFYPFCQNHVDSAAYSRIGSYAPGHKNIFLYFKAQPLRNCSIVYNSKSINQTEISSLLNCIICYNYMSTASIIYTSLWEATRGVCVLIKYKFINIMKTSIKRL